MPSLRCQHKVAPWMNSWCEAAVKDVHREAFPAPSLPGRQAVIPFRQNTQLAKILCIAWEPSHLKERQLLLTPLAERADMWAGRTCPETEWPSQPSPEGSVEETSSKDISAVCRQRCWGWPWDFRYLQLCRNRTRLLPDPVRVVLCAANPAAWVHASSDISASRSLLVLLVLVKERDISYTLRGGPICTIHFKIGWYLCSQLLQTDFLYFLA